MDWTEHSIKGRRGIHDRTKLWIGQNTQLKEGGEYKIGQSCGFERLLCQRKEGTKITFTVPLILKILIFILIFLIVISIKDMLP